MVWGGVLCALCGCAAARGDLRHRQLQAERSCQRAERSSEQRAMTECRRCLELVPEDQACKVILYESTKRAAQNHYIHGVMLHAQGRDLEAQKEFEEAATLDPDRAAQP